MHLFRNRKSELPSAEEALPGRAEPLPVPERHAVLGRPLLPPYPEGVDHILLAMGCYWGAERLFWQTPGVWTTAVGFAGGHTPNPTYREVCTGRTGHAEVVLVAYETTRLPLDEVLRLFWEGHDPTQGMRQGADVGTQYRSAIYWLDEGQRDAALRSRDLYAAALAERGLGPITTEIAPAGPFYPAEGYHQQYLHKVPDGYCGIGGTGVACPVGLGVSTEQPA